jgi:hypothetical protein
MLVLHNMDELMEMELDGPELKGKGNKVFAAGHACVCNPLKKPHYPKDWYVVIIKYEILGGGYGLITETGFQRTVLSRLSTQLQMSRKTQVRTLQLVL